MANVPLSFLALGDVFSIDPFIFALSCLVVLTISIATYDALFYTPFRSPQQDREDGDGAKAKAIDDQTET